MSIDFETAVAIQKICTGETIELTRGQIAGEVLEIDKLTKGFKAEKAAECRAFYEGLMADDTKKAYDVDLLLEETDAIKKEFDEFYGMLTGKEQERDYAELIAPVFVINAINRSMESGAEEAVKRYEI